MPDRRGWLGPAVAIVAAVTAARIVLLALNRTDLFVDEAQYWLWGQEPAFGYYSKPPLIGWVIRAATDLAGSDTAFWVRLPAPLLHAATALILGRIAAGLWGRKAGILAAAVYVTLPMVALGSLLISTDTVMLPFLALALGLWLALLNGTPARPAALAAGAGAALGLAFLAKYAAAYALILAALAALHPRWRPGAVAGAAALAAFAAVIAPNVAWNLANGLTTLQHTMDNAGWVRGGPEALDPARMVEFLVAQFAVIGPVPFAALLALGIRRLAGPLPQVPGLLLWLAWPIVLAVGVQALLEGAYANWAVAAYAAGTLAVVPWLAARPRWCAASFAINGAICLALPLAAAFPEAIRRGGDPLLDRYLGRADLSRQIIDAATAAGATAIVANNRDILADLFHTGRDAGIAFYAPPRPGRPPHYYAQLHSLPGAVAGPILVAGIDAAALPCAAVPHPDGPITAGPGAHAGREIALWIVPGDCWAGG